MKKYNFFRFSNGDELETDRKTTRRKALAVLLRRLSTLHLSTKNIYVIRAWN